MVDLRLGELCGVEAPIRWQHPTRGMVAPMDLSVVAEGVEGPSHVTALRDLGCDIAQGYHYARPMPPEDLAAWVRNSGAGRTAAEVLAAGAEEPRVGTPRPV